MNRRSTCCIWITWWSIEKAWQPSSCSNSTLRDGASSRSYAVTSTRMRDRLRKSGSGSDSRLDREGSVVCEVATAQFQLPRPTQPDQPLTVRVALIRDWRKLLGGFAATDESERWKADLAPEQQQFWEPEWQATPAPPAPTRPKLLPIVTTAEEANALELAQTYFRRWIRPGRMRSAIGSFLSTWIRITGMRKSQ